MIATVQRGRWKGNRWVSEEVPIEVFKHPTFNHEYIKQLAIVERCPNITKKQVLIELYGHMKNFGIFDSLFNYGVITKTGVGKYKAPLYSITSKGESLLNEARETKFIFDLINMVKMSNARTLEEFDVVATCAGEHTIVEPDFVLKVKDAIDTYRWLRTPVIKNIPFFKDYMKIADGAKA